MSFCRIPEINSPGCLILMYKLSMNVDVYYCVLFCRVCNCRNKS